KNDQYSSFPLLLFLLASHFLQRPRWHRKRQLGPAKRNGEPTKLQTKRPRSPKKTTSRNAELTLQSPRRRRRRPRRRRQQRRWRLRRLKSPPTVGKRNTLASEPAARIGMLKKRREEFLGD